MTKTTPISPEFNRVAGMIRANHLEQAASIGARIANALVAVWREVQAPPRPAWIIMASRSWKRRGELKIAYAPR